MKNKKPKTIKIPIEEPKIGGQGMNDSEMWEFLIALHDTVYWHAIKRYNDISCIEVENSLCSIDPFKEPTNMARNQGIRVGLMKLTQTIETEVQRRLDLAKGKNINSFSEEVLPGGFSGY